MDKSDEVPAGGAATGNRTEGMDCVPALVPEEVENRKKRSRADRDVCQNGTAFQAQQIQQHRLPTNVRATLSSTRRFADSRDFERALAHRYETMHHTAASLVQQQHEQMVESAHQRTRSLSDWIWASRTLDQQPPNFIAESVARRWSRLDLLHHLIRCEEQKVQQIGRERVMRCEPTYGTKLGDAMVSRMIADGWHNERTTVVHVNRRDVPERISSTRHRRTGSGIASAGLQPFRGEVADQLTSCQEGKDSKPPSQIQSSPQSLALPSDEGIFSGTQLLIRQSILVFQAQPRDIDFFANSQGRNKRVALGQVGLRCRYCAKRPLHYCGRGSVYFPGSLSTIYQAAQNMATNHFLSGCCEDMPSEVKEAFSTEINKKKRKKAKRSAGKEYWECACRNLGLEDREGHYGVWYRSTFSKV